MYPSETALVTTTTNVKQHPTSSLHFHIKFLGAKIVHSRDTVTDTDSAVRRDVGLRVYVLYSAVRVLPLPAKWHQAAIHLLLLAHRTVCLRSPATRTSNSELLAL